METIHQTEEPCDRCDVRFTFNPSTIRTLYENKLYPILLKEFIISLWPGFATGFYPVMLSN